MTIADYLTLHPGWVGIVMVLVIINLFANLFKD